MAYSKFIQENKEFIVESYTLHFTGQNGVTLVKDFATDLKSAMEEFKEIPEQFTNVVIRMKFHEANNPELYWEDLVKR